MTFAIPDEWQLSVIFVGEQIFRFPPPTSRDIEKWLQAWVS
jgi:hypothetical protein